MILFRCNVSPSVGAGHLTRCRTLAAMLVERGVACAMAGPEESWRLPGDDALFQSWTPLTWTTGEADAEAFIALAERLGARVAVMDDYRMDEPYQLRLRSAGLTWLQQFDASNPPPFWADFVANGGPRETPEHYRALARNPALEFLLGPEFAVLRPAFCNLPPRKAGRPLKRLLISFGGGDDRGMVVRTLEALMEGPDDLSLRVMSGAGNPGNGSIQSWIADHAPDRAMLAVNPEDVAGEYLNADLAVIAGGTSTFEAAAAGVPMLITAMADNQIRQGLGWQDRGAAIYLGRAPEVNPLDIAAHVAALAADDGRRTTMSRAGQANVDGQGCARLVDRLIGALN
ncbi:PseG/SpsG family protein [Brevundimonas sp.]|uniref:PseG/SpsG family protein n=1 Tax=Brevundimonas sp. TaxID=1871086 RepID=UPI00391D951B